MERYPHTQSEQEQVFANDEACRKRIERFTKRCGLKVRRCNILSRPNCLRGWKPHLRKSLAKWLQYFENRSSPNTMVFGIRMQQMRSNGRTGDEPRHGLVSDLPASAIRIGRHGIPGYASPAENMVPGHVDDMRIEKRQQRAPSSAFAWPSQLQHGMALSPQAPPGHGPPGPQPVERDRQGG